MLWTGTPQHQAPLPPPPPGSANRSLAPLLAERMRQLSAWDGSAAFRVVPVAAGPKLHWKDRTQPEGQGGPRRLVWGVWGGWPSHRCGNEAGAEPQTQRHAHPQESKGGQGSIPDGEFIVIDEEDEAAEAADEAEGEGPAAEDSSDGEPEDADGPMDAHR